MIRNIKWSDRASILRYAVLYGELDTMDPSGHSLTAPALACQELAREGLLRSDGWQRWVITDEGRDWLADL